MDSPGAMALMWPAVKTKIMNSAWWCKHQEDKPDDFWPSLLQEQPIQLPDQIKKLIQIVLVLATSSADVERLFSVSSLKIL